MNFQGSKPEIEAPESKTYILHCKMYVFFNFGMKFQGSKLEIEAPESKTYILHLFQFWNEISRFQTWNSSPRGMKF